MSVQQLTYTIKPIGDGHELKASSDSPEFQLGDFTCVAAGNELTATPRTPFGDLERARSVIEPLLNNWAIEFERMGLPIAFRYSSGHVLTDGPEGHRHVLAAAELHAGVSVSMSVKATMPFNGPEGGYVDGPVVDYVRSRWLRSLSDSRELPPARAYAFLTWLEAMGGNRNQAAAMFNIDMAVLDMVGRLSAKNDPQIGRKLKGQVESLTPVEVGWLNEFVREAAWRVIEKESGMDLSPLRPNDLPDLAP